VKKDCPRDSVVPVTVQAVVTASREDKAISGRLNEYCAHIANAGSLRNRGKR